MARTIKSMFDFIAESFISYGLVGYMVNLVYVNVVSFTDYERYVENYQDYSVQVGLCVWSSLLYFFLSFKLPYCKETKVLAVSILAMTVLYLVRGMEDDEYNRWIQIILGVSSLVIYLIVLGRRVVRDRGCKLHVMYDFLKIYIKCGDCNKALREYLVNTKKEVCQII